MGNKLARGVLEAITIGLRKRKEKKNSNKVQVCLITFKVIGVQN